MHARVTLAVAAALLSSLPSAASARTLRLSPFLVFGEGAAETGGRDGPATLEEIDPSAPGDAETVPALIVPTPQAVEVAPSGESPASLDAAEPARAVAELPEPPPLLTDEAEIQAAQNQLKRRMIRLFRETGDGPSACCVQLAPGGAVRLERDELIALMGPSKTIDLVYATTDALEQLDPKRGLKSAATACLAPPAVGLVLGILGLLSPCMGLGCIGRETVLIFPLLGGVVGAIWLPIELGIQSSRRAALLKELGVESREELLERLSEYEVELAELLRAHNARLAAELGVPPLERGPAILPHLWGEKKTPRR